MVKNKKIITAGIILALLFIIAIFIFFIFRYNRYNSPNFFGHKYANKGENLSKTDTEKYRKAYIAAIQADMLGKVATGSICRSRGGKILSGNGGDAFCGNENMGIWQRFYDICGSNSDNTQWVVFNGDTDNWNVTLKCANFTYCNGPSNAICNANGCKFQGSCQ